MFKRYLDAFKDYKKEKKVYRKNNLIKRVLFFAICLLLTFAGIRTYSLYNYYRDSNEQDLQIEQSIEDTSDSILQEFLLAAYRNAYYHNKSDSYNLQTSLIDEHGVEKVYDCLVNGNFSDEIYKTFIDVFSNLYKDDQYEYDNFVVVANDEGIVYVKSNNKLDKFDDLHQDNEIISWEEFIAGQDNPEVAKKAYADAYYKAYTTDPVIIRIDGQYDSNEYYTLDDLYEIYKKEGIAGLKGYGFLVVSTITDKGDMYGNVDNTFMHSNEVHKLYVYHYIDVTVFLEEHEATLNKANDVTLTMLDNMQLERKVSTLISCVSLFIIVIVVICLMMVYKEIEFLDIGERKPEDEHNNDKPE